MSAEAQQPTDWTERTRGFVWTQTLSGFGADAGLDATNVDLLFEARTYGQDDEDPLFSVSKSGGGITVNSSSSCTVKVPQTLTALAVSASVHYQLWLVDTTTGERYLLHYGRIPVRPWAPS